MFFALLYLLLLTKTIIVKGCFAKIIVPFFVGVLFGWWHEGLSLPMIVGSLVYFCVNKEKLSKQQCSLFVGAVLGLLVLIHMPAFGNMVGERSSFLVKEVWWETIVHVFTFNFFSYVFIILLCGFLFAPKTRLKLLENRNEFSFLMLIFTFAILSTLLYLKFYNGPRTGAFGQMISIIGIIRLMSFFIKHKVSQTKKKRLYLVVIFICITNLSYACYIQCGLTKEYNLVEAQRWNSDGTENIIFYDYTPIRLDMSFLKPSYFILNTEYGRRGAIILPESLKNFTPQSPDVKKCLSSNLYLFHNRIIGKNLNENKRLLIQIYSSSGVMESRTRILRFKVIDGEQYYYVLPHSQSLGNDDDINDIKIVDLIEEL